MNEFDKACPGKKNLDWVGPMVLCREELIRMPAEVPGVYLLHVFRPGRGLYEVFYAGKTTDLRGRLRQHLQSLSTCPDVRWLRDVATLYFSASPVICPDERAAIEAGLIQILRPPYNRQVPRGTGTWPTLPPLTL